MNPIEGTVTARWRRTPRGIVFAPLTNDPNSASCFSALEALLAATGGQCSVRVSREPSGDFLATNLLLREPTLCPDCNAPLLGPEELAVCGSCGFRRAAREGAPPTVPETRPCPDCRHAMVWRGVATTCTNCGYAVCPC